MVVIEPLRLLSACGLDTPPIAPSAYAAEVSSSLLSQCICAGIGNGSYAVGACEPFVLP